MVVEDLLSPRNVKRHAIFMTIFAFALCSIALWSSYLIFPTYTPILTISFITIGTVPIIHRIFINAEHIQEKILNRLVIHRELIKIYAFFFIGLVIAFAFWYVILPAQPTNICLLGQGNCITGVSKEAFFGEQMKTLEGISDLKSKLTGNAIGPAGTCSGSMWCWFEVIFLNNLEIMMLAIIFSFLYGAGAIFLIAWNASVIGILIGQNILLANHWGFLGLLPHGIPELVSYFAAAIAGGLLSAAIVKRHMSKFVFKKILEECLIFFIIALISLAMGALIESYAIVGDEMQVTVLSTIYLVGLMLFMVQFRKQESIDTGLVKYTLEDKINASDY